jgi:hypothetical protein
MTEAKDRKPDTDNGGTRMNEPNELVAERRELVRRMIGVMSKGMRPPSRAEFDQQNVEATCDNCGVWGCWISNREDALPVGHEGDVILCGGDAPGLRPDRPYCDYCQMRAEDALQAFEAVRGISPSPEGLRAEDAIRRLRDA